MQHAAAAEAAAAACAVIGHDVVHRALFSPRYGLEYGLVFLRFVFASLIVNYLIALDSCLHFANRAGFLRFDTLSHRLETGFAIDRCRSFYDRHKLALIGRLDDNYARTPDKSD